MNDFTKYELHSLIWAVNYARDNTTNCSDVMLRARKKLQSLIDNYCEHKKTQYYGDVAVGECKECLKVIL